jgi:hypothetical protein
MILPHQFRLESGDFFWQNLMKTAAAVLLGLNVTVYD